MQRMKENLEGKRKDEVGFKREISIDISRFSESRPNVQFQSSPKASSAPYHKLAFSNKKVE